MFLATSPPAHAPITVRMGSKVIDIPAGARDYAVTDTYELPADVELLSVYPHAHYLARDMRVTARFPGGSEQPLLHIAHWNFHWQQDYRFVTPVSLPRGTTLTMRYTYDNSADNEHNPNSPPKRVLSGPLSTDEMAELGLQILPKSPADALQILQAFDRRERLGNIALGELRVRVEPDNAENHAFLGGSYVEVERFADGMRHLEIAMKRGDRTAGTHNYYAVALKALGREDEALTHFRRAADLAPRDEVMSFNLGTALAERGRGAEAAAAFERSLKINPEYPDAHVNMGALLLARRRFPEAISHFQQAVALRPDSAAMHNNLGGALASAGRLVEGMQHVRRALQIDPAYGPALDNFGRLQRLGIK